MTAATTGSAVAITPTSPAAARRRAAMAARKGIRVPPTPTHRSSIQTLVDRCRGKDHTGCATAQRSVATSSP